MLRLRQDQRRAQLVAMTASRRKSARGKANALNYKEDRFVVLLCYGKVLHPNGIQYNTNVIQSTDAPSQDDVILASYHLQISEC